LRSSASTYTIQGSLTAHASSVRATIRHVLSTSPLLQVGGLVDSNNPTHKAVLDASAIAIKRGEVTKGEAGLRWVLERDPDSVLALLWMTKCVEDPTEKLRYFQRVLQIDPTNAHALKGIQLLSGESSSTASSHPTDSPAPSPSHTTLAPKPFKPCPFCKEPMAADAATCPACNRRIYPGSADPSEAPDLQPPYSPNRGARRPVESQPARQIYSVPAPPGARPPPSSSSCVNFAFYSIFAIIALWILSLLSQCAGDSVAILKRAFYKPTSGDAFSYAAGFAHEKLATYQAEPFLNPGCEDSPEWYMVSVADLGNATFRVVGRVVTGNIYCVKDESSFTATVQYLNKQWNLIGAVDFSNMCVLHAAYAYQPASCSSTQWRPP